MDYNAKEAGVYIVMANLNPDQGYKGITSFIVDRDATGFSVSKKEDKLGIELLLRTRARDCEVPHENLLGKRALAIK